MSPIVITAWRSMLDWSHAPRLIEQAQRLRVAAPLMMDRAA